MTQPHLQSSAWYRAMTLAERRASLHGMPSAYRAAAIDTALAQGRMEQWRSQPPFSTDSYFAQRLAMDGLSEEELFYLLGEPVEAVQQRLPNTPAWLQGLEQAFARPVDANSNGRSQAQMQRHPGMDGLLEVIRPCIDRAREELRQRLRALLQIHPRPPFDPDTVEALLMAHLPPRLLQMLSRTMVLELNVARLQGLLTGQTPEERFESFVQGLQRREVALAILQEYPVLARQLTRCIGNWVASSLEFLHHLSDDWGALRKRFQAAIDAGMLVAVSAGVGDSHRGGRAVIIATFDSGFQLVYKPRSLAVDVHFQELLTWLNRHGDHPAFRTLTILDRGTHGWAEFVVPQSCHSVQQVQRFYQRQGGYLAILHALAAIDCHFENLIAAGEHPILVDIETLFHPTLETYDAQQADQLATKALADSVIRIGLLPYRMGANAASEGIDISGLGAAEGQLTPYHVPYWEGERTDAMQLRRKQKKLVGGTNRPTLNGQEVEMLDYVDAITSGFTTVYGVLRKYREELLSGYGPLTRFAGDEVRVVLRPTRTYRLLLNEGCHPDVLRDALDRDRLFDRLWVQVERSRHLSRAIPEEREDLQDGNIPKFTTIPGSRHLWSSAGRRMDDFFEVSGLDFVRRRLQRFNDADLTHQLWFIRASLATLAHGTSHLFIPPPCLRASPTIADNNSLLTYAQTIGDQLAALALRGADDAAWFGLVSSDRDYWSLAPLGPDLYNGLSGVALFLAYLGAMTGGERYTELAHATLKTIRRQIERCAMPPNGVKPEQSPMLPVGGFDGWGGVIYTLVHLGVLWHQPSLLSEAEAYVRLLPPLIAADEALDLISGSAGCIGSLLSLYRCTPSKPTLDAAIRCGNRLVERAQPMATGVGWMTRLPTSQPLTGFARGAAGMAWALLSLTALTGDERFRHTALQAIAYERSGFWPKARNGRDRREPTSCPEAEHQTPHRLMTSWCQGASGIGLARLSSLEHLHDSAVRAEINLALETTLAQGFGRNHCLCHGDLGNLELVLQASRTLDTPQWKAAVQRLAASVAASMERHGWLCGIPLRVQSPGLMTGLAGIGYGLLRLADPTRVPSVLMLEGPRIEEPDN